MARTEALRMRALIRCMLVLEGGQAALRADI